MSMRGITTCSKDVHGKLRERKRKWMLEDKIDNTGCGVEGILYFLKPGHCKFHLIISPPDKGSREAYRRCRQVDQMDCLLSLYP